MFDATFSVIIVRQRLIKINGKTILTNFVVHMQQFVFDFKTTKLRNLYGFVMKKINRKFAVGMYSEYRLYPCVMCESPVRARQEALRSFI
jgi:hypothetical protein